MDFPSIPIRSWLPFSLLYAGKARRPELVVGWTHNLPHDWGCAENKARRRQVPTIVNSNGRNKNCLKEFPTANKALRWIKEMKSSQTKMQSRMHCFSGAGSWARPKKPHFAVESRQGSQSPCPRPSQLPQQCHPSPQHHHIHWEESPQPRDAPWRIPDSRDSSVLQLTWKTTSCKVARALLTCAWSVTIHSLPWGPSPTHLVP